MKQESTARTPGEIQTRLVAGVMTTGILCAISGGVWINGGSALANFVNYSAAIFTIFAFVATLLQLQSIRRLRDEKEKLMAGQRQAREKAVFREQMVRTEQDLEYLQSELKNDRFKSASTIAGYLVRNYRRVAAGHLPLQNASLQHKLRVCINEICNLQAMLRIMEEMKGVQKEEAKKTIGKIITYIERENENIKGGGEPARDGKTIP